jgi:sigma-54 dependent transcriptional regulator, acetoin dehydrogenase operon transcriptional activator AcoR
MHHHVILPSPQVRQARLQLVEQGIAPAASIDRHVVQSWQRSLGAGLSPVGRIDCSDNLTGSALQRCRSLNRALIGHSEPVMEYLFEQVRHSHSMVILADAQGTLMHTLGDLDFLNKADRVALRLGASWAESQRGTNAIGTALAEVQAIEIHGSEHYLDRNGFLTCAAAPIVSARGQLMGILDISGDHRARHPHTLGLVSTAAQMIENSLVLAECRQHMVVKLHPRAAGVGSVAQGLLAFDDDGWLVGANRTGLALMDLPTLPTGQTHWSALFREPLHALESGDHSHRHLLHTHSGNALYAQGQRPHTQRVHAASTAPRVTGDALSRLDAGDATSRRAADMARKVMDKGIPLLIGGESGVGKDWFAQAVHQCSQRRDRAWVAVNCAALPESLIEAELFGYAPGAFTGASRQGSVGRIREANGGTLFLDEIGDMPLSAQTRLLRVLQERSVTAVGSGTSTPVDFNLICASHQDLKQAVVQGRFRQDLYYRINGLSLTLPPLRERTDFVALCERLLQQAAPNIHVAIAPDVMEHLRRFVWPGNLRQLNHVLRCAIALLDEDERVIDWAHMPDDITQELQAKPVVRQDAPAQNWSDLSHKAIDMALENTRGNVSAAARQLGISRQTLYRKLHERAARS